jgi:glyoxylase-like metal-dependent hydrolase (beta-lactamase superfamily II)
MFLDEASLVAGVNGATFRRQAPVASWVEIPVAAYLLETPAGLMLYDTGCHEREAVVAPGEDTPSPYVFRPEQLLPARLDSLGVKPGDISRVVMSHLHCDHAGYLYMFGGAEVVVSDAEFTGALRLRGLRGFGAGPYKTADFDAFLDSVSDWSLLGDGETERELCPGVTAVNLGSGHAFGMTALLVELPRSGNYLLCSDALYRSDNLGPPIRPPGLVYDSLGYVASANFIARYAKRHSARIIFGHDMAQFRQLRSEGGVWE